MGDFIQTNREIRDMLRGKDTNFPALLAVEKGKSVFVRTICTKCGEVDISFLSDQVHYGCGGKIAVVWKEYASASHTSYRTAEREVNEGIDRLIRDKSHREATANEMAGEQV